MQVKEVLQIKGSTLFTATPESPLSDAVVTMAENDIGSLMIMDHGKLVGVLTFREVIAVLAKRQKERRVGPTPPIAEIKVSEAMQREPFLTHQEMDLDELRSLMIEKHARYVPVMERETVLGVISFHDVARAVLEEKNFENRMLKGYIKNWPA
ncbi:MAG: CBS domain-containing protein [Betaproteobacteria bacterium]|jgi:CBS domain-containing protein|nr:CBS domain-containing protein [Betaproteobacteria bacterium]